MLRHVVFANFRSQQRERLGLAGEGGEGLLMRACARHLRTATLRFAVVSALVATVVLAVVMAVEAGEWDARAFGTGIL